MTLGKHIWAGSQKVAKFTEQVNMQVAGEVGRAGDGHSWDWVFILALGGNQCFVVGGGVVLCWGRGCI